MAAQRTDQYTEPARVPTRRRLADDLAPHLVAIRNLTDASDVVIRAASVPVRFGVAAEPLRGPVQRALAQAWRCASSYAGSRAIEVDHRGAISSLLQVHGADWSLVARTGGPALLLFDGQPPAVVDVSSTDLAGLLVDELLSAAARVPRVEPQVEQSRSRKVTGEWVPPQRLRVAAGGRDIAR